MSAGSSIAAFTSGGRSAHRRRSCACARRPYIVPAITNGWLDALAELSRLRPHRLKLAGVAGIDLLEAEWLLRTRPMRRW